MTYLIMTFETFFPGKRFIANFTKIIRLFMDPFNMFFKITIKGEALIAFFANEFISAAAFRVKGILSAY